MTPQPSPPSTRIHPWPGVLDSVRAHLQVDPIDVLCTMDSVLAEDSVIGATGTGEVCGMGSGSIPSGSRATHLDHCQMLIACGQTCG